jgi:signal peptidase II
MIAPKTRVFIPIALTLLLTDCASKRLAVEHLVLHQPRPVVDDLLKLTLTYNKGAALGTSLGPYSRVGFSLIAIVMLVVLVRILRETPPDDRWTGAALALVCGGALGNLVDRLRSPSGVVDFIDVGVGAHRFWIFNVADIGVSVGAATLAFLLWRRGEPQQSG